MKRAIPLILSTVLALLIILSGCNKKKTPNSNEIATFNIKSFWITDEDGVTCLVFEYQTTVRCKMLINTPAGREIAREIEKNTSAISIPISEPMCGILKGNYSIRVVSIEETNLILYNDTIYLEGPQLEILGVTTLWKHDYNSYQDVLYDVSVIVKNRGDAPAYVGYAELVIDDVSCGLFNIKGSVGKIIQPKERKVLKLDFTEMVKFQPNFSHEIKLILYDKYGHVLDSYTQIRRMNIT